MSTQPVLPSTVAYAIVGLLLLLPSSPASADDLRPSWRILALVYQTTDFSYQDAQGFNHRVVGGLTAQDVTRADAILRQFAYTDVPQLTSGNQFPTLTVRVLPALTKLSRIGQRSWWPAPADLGADRDPAFDSVIVVWQTIGIDQVSGRTEQLSAEFGGLASYGTNAYTYASTSIFGRNLFGFGRNLLKHEWGHGILMHFDRTGASPRPVVDNHIDNTTNRYVNCVTGAPYILVDETDANPIPNSIYNNDSGFTHDYYSGMTARAEEPQRCLGITPAAWATGGPVTKTGGTPAPAPPGTPANLGAVVTGTSVTLSWQPSGGATSYRIRAGTAPQSSNLYDRNVGSVTSVFANALAPGTYYVRVHAVGLFGESGPSNEAVIQIPGGSSCPAPAAPSLSGSTAGTTVTLTWSSQPGVTGYLLEAGSAPGGAELGTFSFGSGTSSFTANDVPAGAYHLRIRAVTACGAGPPSVDIRIDVR